MIYEYKLACIEAGLSEDKIREIAQVFDTEYKRNDYDEKNVVSMAWRFSTWRE